MRILAITGAPATGKTTLMKRIIEELGGVREEDRYGLLDYALVGDVLNRVTVLGKYGGTDAFGGTDKLSMAVQPDAEAFLIDAEAPRHAIAFEGDRLCNLKFLRACEKAGETLLITLELSRHRLRERRDVREAEVGDVQDPTWLAGRESKVARLHAEFGGDAVNNLTLDIAQDQARSLAGWLLGQHSREIRKPLRLF